MIKYIMPFFFKKKKNIYNYTLECFLQSWSIKSQKIDGSSTEEHENNHVFAQKESVFRFGLENRLLL